MLHGRFTLFYEFLCNASPCSCLFCCCPFCSCPLLLLPAPYATLISASPILYISRDLACERRRWIGLGSADSSWISSIQGQETKTYTSTSDLDCYALEATARRRMVQDAVILKRSLFASMFHGDPSLITPFNTSSCRSHQTYPRLKAQYLARKSIVFKDVESVYLTSMPFDVHSIWAACPHCRERILSFAGGKEHTVHKS
jgi:hypothetical protein